MIEKKEKYEKEKENLKKEILKKYFIKYEEKDNKLIYNKENVNIIIRIIFEKIKKYSSDELLVDLLHYQKYFFHPRYQNFVYFNDSYKSYRMMKEHFPNKKLLFFKIPFNFLLNLFVINIKKIPLVYEKIDVREMVEIIYEISVLIELLIDGNNWIFNFYEKENRNKLESLILQHKLFKLDSENINVMEEYILFMIDEFSNTLEEKIKLINVLNFLTKERNNLYFNNLKEIKEISNCFVQSIHTLKEEELFLYQKIEYKKAILQIGKNKYFLLPKEFNIIRVTEGFMEYFRKKNKNFDGILGLKMEKFLKHYFDKNDIKYKYGYYYINNNEVGKKGDFDLILEDEENIIIFELKKKSFTQEAKKGNIIALYEDFKKSLLKAYIQAETNELNILENESLLLFKDQKFLERNGKIARNGRRIYKILISQYKAEDISLNEYFNALFYDFINMEIKGIIENDIEIHEKLKESLNNDFEILRSNFERKNKINQIDQVQEYFYDLSTFSIFQIITLIQCSNNKKEFMNIIFRLRAFSNLLNLDFSSNLLDLEFYQIKSKDRLTLIDWCWKNKKENLEFLY